MDKDTRIIVDEAVRIVEAAGPGAVFSAARLVRLVAEQASPRIDVDGLDFFEIDFEIRERLENSRSIVLDGTRHFGKIAGVPYCLDFVVRRRPPAGHAWTAEDLEGLESLFFSIGDFHQGRHEVAVVRDSGRWRSVIDSWGAGRMSIGSYCMFHELDARQMGALRQGLGAADVLSWRGSYHSDCLDGTQWELQLGLAGGLMHTSCGSNRFPQGFDQLLDALEAVGLTGIAGDFAA